MRISICPLTAFTTSGKARKEEGRQSSRRPPWLETEIITALLASEDRQEKNLTFSAAGFKNASFIY